MKKLSGFNLEKNSFDLIKEDCIMIFDDIKNFPDRKVVNMYGDTLCPIIIKPGVNTFEIEFTYIDTSDNLFGYNTANFNYESILQDDYELALEKFLNICENTYSALFVED